MPARHQTEHTGKEEGSATRGGGTLSFDPDPPVTNLPATLTVAGAPADADIVVTISHAAGGGDERQVRTDETGAATVEIVPIGSGMMTVTANQVTVTELASAEVDVSGSPTTEQVNPSGRG